VNDFTEYSSNMYTRTLLQGRRKWKALDLDW
jgi:hypothetical protein